jgi:hypothetical protein
MMTDSFQTQEEKDSVRKQYNVYIRESIPVIK